LFITKECFVVYESFVRLLSS